MIKWSFITGHKIVLLSVGSINYNDYYYYCCYNIYFYYKYYLF